MHKLFGAIMIIFCGLLLSCTPLLKLMERKRLLSELTSILEKLHSELCTSAPALPQLMERVGTEHPIVGSIVSEMQENGPISFYDAWHKSIDREVYLTEEERNSLHGLGDVLGRYVLEEQLTAIARTLEVLREGYLSAKLQLAEVSRLYIGTGLSLSAMLVIILL